MFKKILPFIVLSIIISLYSLINSVGKTEAENILQIKETSIVVGKVNVSFCIPEETLTDCKTRVSKSSRLPEEHLLWVYWNYPTDDHLLYQNIHLRAAQIHNKHMTLLKVNDSNVRDFIPDLPEEWFRLYNQARSDVLRAGLLFH